MGSNEKPRISKATLDKKADSSLVSILKQSFNQLEKENKELKESEQLRYERIVELTKENKELKKQLEDQANCFAREQILRELDDK